ncbi:MAG: hypothetical protein LBI82_12290 [Dysgonamonadaceae bacterium]|jgi:DNA repair protein RadC|nr:hypothetical protein [Dysgonamonadaceae bacterium]
MKVDYFTIPEITISYKDNVKTSERAVIRCSKDVADLLSVVYEDFVQHHEEFHVLYLNQANRVLGISCVGRGGINGVFVDVRIILQTALKACAQGICISHYAK